MKNIIMVGFMGSGKTTVGKILAKKLGLEFFDTDRKIEEAQGMKITEIFEKKGEPFFRSLERDIACDISESENTVIGTGGGMVKNDEIMRLLKKNGIVVYLKATPEKLAYNLRNDNTRPLLMGGDKLEKIRTVLEERQPLYEEVSDITVSINRKTPKKVAEEIIKKLEGII